MLHSSSSPGSGTAGSARYYNDEEMIKCTRFAAKTLASAMPGRICVWKDEWPVVIFTNGACEDEGRLVTHGAVLCDWSSGTYLVFGDHVPEPFVNEWQSCGRKQKDLSS